MSDERLARVALSRLVEPEDVEVHDLVSRLGVVRAVERIVAGGGTLARFAARVSALDVDRDLAAAHRVGARIVLPGDDEWPLGLDDLERGPWVLWVRGEGHLAQLVSRSVAVVGARLATRYGEQTAAELAATLGSTGWCVVSGGALGIDSAAHRGALAVEAATVAVMACGIDRSYPASNTELLQRVAASGVVATETAPGSAPMKSRFLHRNRLIAAMTQGTVVVEAGLRSGSRNTVRHASDLNRPVGAFPGPVTSTESAGCHQEIRDGRAVLVTGAREVVELVGHIGDDAAPADRSPALVVDALPDADRAVLEVVPYRKAVDLDEVARLTTLPVLAVRAALARLEGAGLVDAVEGRWRKSRASAQLRLAVTPVEAGA
jgi:DNA processing protein